VSATCNRGAMLVCASHSPLMLVDMPRSAPDSQDFLEHAGRVRARVAAFAPDLIVVFGPDHFNGFFFDLMPVFCIGAEAASTEDWQLPKTSLNVPSALALECVDALRAADFDVALSWRMKVDHGITIPLKLFTGLPPTVARFGRDGAGDGSGDGDGNGGDGSRGDGNGGEGNARVGSGGDGAGGIEVLPIFVNCAAPPRASFRRVRRFGEEVGRFLSTLDRRILILGSGGLSHDPPTPHFADAPPGIRQRLVDRNTPSHDDYRTREARVVRAAHSMVSGIDGGGPCRRPDEAWDRRVIDLLARGDLAAFDAFTDDAIDGEAGFGGHEIRCWVAACAAAMELGPFADSPLALDYYRLVPEWITGMGLMTAGPR
jgi:2,3-dihydroxyphenylpropionate 1,2-dioxygenase